MTQTATRTSARPAAAAARTLEIEVGRGGKAVIDKAANARIDRLQAERAEKPIKEKLKDLWSAAADELKVGDVLVVKAMGVVRGQVKLVRRAPAVDLDLLMQAYPEAYAACVDTEVYSPQFDPA